LIIFLISVSNYGSATLLKVTFRGLPPHGEADVGPGDSGVAFFEGEVVATGTALGNFQQLIIDLRADAGNWGAAVIPSRVILRPEPPFREASHPITVVVRAPPYEHYTNVEDGYPPHSVNLTGVWQAVPGTAGTGSGAVEPQMLRVSVRQFYRLLVDSPDPFLEAWPGTERKFALVIINQGNGEDKFKISVENRDILTVAGWSVTIDKPEIDVPYRGKGKVEITVSPPLHFISLWRTQVIEIALKITSERSITANEEYGTLIEDRIYPVFYYERGFYYSIEAMILTFIIVIVIIMFVWWWRVRKRRYQR
jgi:hypothetical protein